MKAAAAGSPIKSLRRGEEGAKVVPRSSSTRVKSPSRSTIESSSSSDEDDTLKKEMCSPTSAALKATSRALDNSRASSFRKLVVSRKVALEEASTQRSEARRQKSMATKAWSEATTAKAVAQLCASALSKDGTSAEREMELHALVEAAMVSEDAALKSEERRLKETRALTKDNDLLRAEVKRFKEFAAFVKEDRAASAAAFSALRRDRDEVDKERQAALRQCATALEAAANIAKRLSDLETTGKLPNRKGGLDVELALIEEEEDEDEEERPSQRRKSLLKKSMPRVPPSRHSFASQSSEMIVDWKDDTTLAPETIAEAWQGLSKQAIGDFVLDQGKATGSERECRWFAAVNFDWGSKFGFTLVLKDGRAAIDDVTGHAQSAGLRAGDNVVQIGHHSLLDRTFQSKDDIAQVARKAVDPNKRALTFIFERSKNSTTHESRHEQWH